MTRAPVTALILAGGRGRRFGGADKALIGLAGMPLIGHIIARIAGQVDRIVINANGDAARFTPFGYPVIADDPAQGPGGAFAGLATAHTLMAAEAGAASWLLTVPTDTPFLPADLVGHLASPLASGRATAAFAASAGVAHPIVALWGRAALVALMQRIRAGDVRRLQTLLPAIGGMPVTFPADRGDPFFNVNTPADLATAAARLAAPTASPGSG